jgi:hypothetical protein
MYFRCQETVSGLVLSPYRCYNFKDRWGDRPSRLSRDMCFLLMRPDSPVQPYQTYGRSPGQLWHVWLLFLLGDRTQFESGFPSSLSSISSSLLSTCSIVLSRSLVQLDGDQLIIHHSDAEHSLKVSIWIEFGDFGLVCVFRRRSQLFWK